MLATALPMMMIFAMMPCYLPPFIMPRLLSMLLFRRLFFLIFRRRHILLIWLPRFTDFRRRYCLQCCFSARHDAIDADIDALLIMSRRPPDFPSHHLFTAAISLRLPAIYH